MSKLRFKIGEKVVIPRPCHKKDNKKTIGTIELIGSFWCSVVCVDGRVWSFPVENLERPTELELSLYG